MQRQQALKQLAGIEQKIAGIVRAIEDSAYNPTLKERLTALENEKATAESRIAQMV